MQTAESPDTATRLQPLTAGDRMLRAVWAAASLLLFRPTPRPLHAWRRWLLRAFGAKIGKSARIYPTVKIWAPWNLVLKNHSCLGYYVDCYNCARITLEEGAMVSQYSFLCTGTHDYRSKAMPLVAKPIIVGKNAWVCADVFVGPGVTVGEGAVVAARSSVYRDVAPWTVVAGNPAGFLKTRSFPD